MTATTPRLLLVDGHSLAYRAFFALPVENFSTTTGQPTNAVYGFTSMLINVLRDEQPTHIVVAFDVSRHSFRTEKYAEYKAGRSETPADFKGQVSLVKEVLDALRIPVVEKEGYEADDVIATLACQARDQGMQVLISTGDRDAFQLVGDTVTVLYPRKGVSDLARMDPAAIEAKYGVAPAALPRPGRPGRRDQRQPARHPRRRPQDGRQVDHQYGGVEGVIAHADEIKGKAGDSLRERLADVIRNYEINCLVSDLELPLRPEDARWQGWDREAVHQVFDTLQFRILRDRLYQYLEAVEPEAEAGFDLTAEVLTAPGAVTGWLATHAPVGTQVGVAVKTPAKPKEPRERYEPQLEALAFALASGPAAWLDPTTLAEDDERALAGWLADPQQPKVLHDSKHARLAFAARGWSLAGVARDTAGRRLPGPSRPALLRPDRSGAALPAPRAAGRRAGDRAAHLRRPRRRRRGRAEPDAPGAGHPRPGRRDRRRAVPRRRAVRPV